MVTKPHDFGRCYGGCYGGRIHRTGRGPVPSDPATGETIGQAGRRFASARRDVPPRAGTVRKSYRQAFRGGESKAFLNGRFDTTTQPEPHRLPVPPSIMRTVRWSSCEGAPNKGNTELHLNQPKGDVKNIAFFMPSNQLRNPQMQAQNPFKSGYVSIIGEPNVGKSTLLNAMMGEKLAIVTPKPQTTRNRITGILTTDAYQIIFLDTPGVLTPKYRLHDQMVKAAYTAITDADLVLYMIDVGRLNSGIEKKILDELKKAAQPVILVINKIDLIPPPALLPVIANYQEKFPFLELIPISATTGNGVSQLRESIVKHIPEGPHYFPPDQLSDLPERFFISETIREKIFLRTSQEIPYASSVVVEEFKERPNGKIYINAMLYVERQSQKGILVGKGGKTIKRIGQLARTEIEQFLETTIFLDLRVSVKADWRRDGRKLRDMGYL